MSDEEYSGGCLHDRASKRLKLGEEYSGVEDEREESKLEACVGELDADQVARLCYETFLSLPGRSGRVNNGEEYTILAGLLCNESIVALATGTKCFPENVPSRRTTIVDCHSEPLLKRAAKCHLLGLVREHLSSGGVLDDLYSTVFSKNRYTLFISQTPCGTVSRWKGDSNTEEGVKETKEEVGEPLRSYKTVGVNRKPGRGPLCPSAGCIHKIAKWSYLGLQGKQLFSLIGHVIPIYRIVIGHCEEFPEDSTILDQVLERISIPEEEKKGLVEDLEGISGMNLDSLKKADVELAEKFMEKDLMREDFMEPLDRLSEPVSRLQRRPVGVSIVAWKNGGKTSNFVVDKLTAGRKQGTSKKSANKMLSNVCNQSIDNQYADIMSNLLLAQGSNNDDKEMKDKEEEENQKDNKDKEKEDRRQGKLEQLWNGRKDSYEKCWKLFQERLSIFRGWPEMPAE